MGSESIAHEAEAEWTIDSDAMMPCERINCFSKIQLVGKKKYRGKTTLAS